MTGDHGDRQGRWPEDSVREVSLWGMALGVFLVLLGVLAITHPAFTAIATGLIIAYTLLVAGIASFVVGTADKDTAGKIAHLVFGLLAFAGGAVLLVFPMDGAVELVWLIGSLFIASGLSALLSAGRAAGHRRLRTLLGLADIAIGLYAFLLVPADAVEVLAFLIGISLILRGCLLMLVSSWVRAKSL